MDSYADRLRATIERRKRVLNTFTSELLKEHVERDIRVAETLLRSLEVSGVVGD